MKRNRGEISPVLVLIGLFIVIGLAYGNAKSNGGTFFSPQGPSAIQNGSKGTQTSNQQISSQIKTAEKDIQNLNKEVQKQAEEAKRSPYYEKVRLSNLAGRNSLDPSKQYFSLSTSLKTGETINITGWYLKSDVTGYYAVIGKASLLPFPFTYTESDIVLQPRDRVILVKGFSPIGVSFRTNKCTGYFEENRTFTPSLPFECPRPQDEPLPQFSDIYDRNDECIDLIKRIPRCTTVNSEYLRDLPDTVTSSCKNYMREQIGYNSCVAKHFSDTDFPGNQYRVYLNRFGPLWRTEREKISLYDRNGLVVDSISY